jgi:hypothetical protein
LVDELVTVVYNPGIIAMKAFWKSPLFWRLFTFYMVFYLIFVILVIVGYPLAQQYAKPLASLIFPINGNNPMLKNVIVLTGMYWGMIGIYYMIMPPKKG